MNRRDLLRGALAAGIIGTALGDTCRAFEHTIQRTPSVDVSRFETVAEQYSYGYQGRTPTLMLADLVADFGELRPLLEQPLPVPARTRLCHIAGQMAGMTAIVLHDLGERREARDWFHTAALTVAESGDRTLYAWVLAREAMFPLNFGTPIAAVALAERARHAAGTTATPAATLAAAVAARAYALTGQAEQAHGALADADRLMNRLTGAQRADTWFGHCEQKHHVHLSHALTALGETRRAGESQDRALVLSAPTSSVTRTLLRLDRAACLHRDGATVEACRAAAGALLDVPAEYRTGLTRRRALDLYWAIPARRRMEPAVRELHDLLS